MKIVSSNDKITNKEIINFERDFNINFPDDYKNFLLKFNGGEPYFKTFLTNDKCEYDIMYFYSLSQIQNTMKYEPELIPNGLIPIAIIDGGYFLFISTNKTGFGKIFFGDTNIYSESEEDDLLYMANNFTRFLESLYDPESSKD